jgi:signal transduction histidine kinase
VLTFGRTGGGNLQDRTGGIFLWHLNSSTAPKGYKPGDFYDVEGVTSAGDFSPMVLCRKATALGEGQFPEPLRPNFEELIGGGLDAQWVEVEGVGLVVTNRNLEIGMKGGRISCWMAASAEPYLGAVLRIRGVVLAYHDSERHINGVRINVPSQKFISIETPAPRDPFSAPIRHARDLLTYNPNESAFRRVKVAGQVVHVRNGVYYLMDGTNGLRLVPSAETNAGLGDVVEAVGFPELDSPFDKPRLTLREAVTRKIGRTPLPAATLVFPDDLLNREHDSTLVRLESRLLSVSRYRAEQVFELQSGARVYLARLNAAAGQSPQLRTGSRLELTGVYASGSEKSVPFELLLNSPADIRVLELPSWWTAQHALIVVCALGLLILLAVVWIGLLQQQVGKRTLELSAANQSLKGEIAERQRAENELVRTRLRHLVEQERSRIARDLHDDLGSRVTQIVLLLNELALQNRVPPPGAPEHPLEISAAAQEIIQTLDETVWAVNPRNDTLPHLINYLSQFASEFLRAANVRCRLDFPEHPPARTLSAETRHHLFLAVKEALTNAVRHAHATEVWLRMVLNKDSLVLAIEDNGRGFERPPDDPSADGLRNMRQRLQEIGGRFEIESAPETGTKVTLTSVWPPGE